METWVFGAIVVVVGLLVTFCSLGKTELGITFTLAGLTATSVGLFVFVSKFKQWIENL